MNLAVSHAFDSGSSIHAPARGATTFGQSVLLLDLPDIHKNFLLYEPDGIPDVVFRKSKTPPGSIDGKLEVVRVQRLTFKYIQDGLDCLKLEFLIGVELKFHLVSEVPKGLPPPRGL